MRESLIIFLWCLWSHSLSLSLSDWITPSGEQTANECIQTFSLWPQHFISFHFISIEWVLYKKLCSWNCRFICFLRFFFSIAISHTTRDSHTLALDIINCTIRKLNKKKFYNIESIHPSNPVSTSVFYHRSHHKFVQPEVTRIFFWFFDMLNRSLNGWMDGVRSTCRRHRPESRSHITQSWLSVVLKSHWQSALSYFKFPLLIFVLIYK